MNLYVEIMSKDKCIEIAKIVKENPRAPYSELLEWLPDEVFGRTYRVSFINNSCFEVYAKDGSTDTWSVPTYFVEGTKSSWM